MGESVDRLLIRPAYHSALPEIDGLNAWNPVYCVTSPLRCLPFVRGGEVGSSLRSLAHERLIAVMFPINSKVTLEVASGSFEVERVPAPFSSPSQQATLGRSLHRPGFMTVPIATTAMMPAKSTSVTMRKNAPRRLGSIKLTSLPLTMLVTLTCVPDGILQLSSYSKYCSGSMTTFWIGPSDGIVRRWSWPPTAPFSI